MMGLPGNLCAFQAAEPGLVGSRVRTLVLGCGATGQSIARWLARHGASATFADQHAGANTAAVNRLMPDAEVLCGSFSAIDPTAFERIVASPGIPDHEPLLARARREGIPVLSDIDLFCAEATAPIVAVTGSNGKSTVVSLLDHMCREAGVAAFAGGNLGTPALDLPLGDDVAFYLLELSSFQLQRSGALNAFVACVLNISPDHIDWHGSLAAYRQAKLSVYRHCEYAIVNADEDMPDADIDPQATRIEFTLSAPTARQFGVRMVDGAPWLAFGSDTLLAVAECGVIGHHNTANVLAALAIGSAIDLPMSAMLASVTTFTGLEHRHQKVAEHDGVVWINDSKATNTGAALASVNAVDGDVVLLAGGRGKGEDMHAFAAALPARVRLCIVYGENGPELAAALAGAGRAFLQATDLQAAVILAAREALAGDTVLLAPAAASQDAFTDYRERGQRFAEWVHEVAQ